jgi:hypothetical protein
MAPNGNDDPVMSVGSVQAGRWSGVGAFRGGRLGRLVAANGHAPSFGRRVRSRIAGWKACSICACRAQTATSVRSFVTGTWHRALARRIVFVRFF